MNTFNASKFIQKLLLFAFFYLFLKKNSASFLHMKDIFCFSFLKADTKHRAYNKAVANAHTHTRRPHKRTLNCVYTSAECTCYESVALFSFILKHILLCVAFSHFFLLHCVKSAWAIFIRCTQMHIIFIIV